MKTEQNKLEQEFKSKLQDRTIQPSNAAWDRLDAMLSVAENEKPDTNEKKKPQRLLLYIAASFVAFLLVGVLLLNMQPEINNNPVTIDENAVVNNQQNNNTSTDESNRSNFATNNTTENEIINESSIPVQKQAIAVVSSKQTDGSNENAARDSQELLSKKKNNFENITQSDKLLAVVNESSLNKTENDGVAVGETKIETNGITVDANKLLASVDAEESKQQQIEYTINQGKTKIDSKQLLSSVEEELDQSFRSKVLQSAVKQYNVIKTSVANRNYQ